METYGCQMNYSDTEIINSVLLQAGYELANTSDEADIIFLNTCAIRDNAEQKVWGRLRGKDSLQQTRFLKNYFC